MYAIAKQHIYSFQRLYRDLETSRVQGANREHPKVMIQRDSVPQYGLTPPTRAPPRCPVSSWVFMRANGKPEAIQTRPSNSFTTLLTTPHVGLDAIGMIKVKVKVLQDDLENAEKVHKDSVLTRAG